MIVTPFCTPKNSALNLNVVDVKKVIGDPFNPPLSQSLDNSDIKFDFNRGLRLQIPEGNYHVRIWDSDSQIVLFYGEVSDALLISLEKFFINWEFEIYLDGKLIFHHKYNPVGRNVHFYLYPRIGMGDHIALFPCMEEFCRKWKCTATCEVVPYLRELVENYFPTIKCVDEIPPNTYARYWLYPGFDSFFQPIELRKISMMAMGRELLGLSHVKKKIYFPTKPRQIVEPYVCIAAQTSITTKSWLNSTGWEVVIAYLKNLGYRVLCIDKNRVQTDIFTIKKPAGAEDFTGDIPIMERVNLLAYADFFIGASSGLAWLAWSTDIPVVMISGVTAEWFEFYTPYRVINRFSCRSCHNDDNVAWPQYVICPRHHNTERAYECTRSISARHVINAIDELRQRENLTHT